MPCATTSPPNDLPTSPAGRGGYTESEEAESVADVAPDLLTNFHSAGMLLDFLAAPPLARD
jgi:hypothetical protein